MAKGGGKNAILLIIAVAAIGGAIYGITDYATKSLAEDPAVEERLVNAGICGHCGKYVPLVGHGSLPETCPICNESLEGYSKSGAKLP